MTRTEGRALLLLALLAACAADEPPREPRPIAVVPSIWFATTEATVEITGEDFHVRGVQRADGGGSAVDAVYRAWLGPVELTDVAWIDERSLHARVPAGLAIGWHDLVIEGPHGSGALPHAYLVIDGVPPSLGLSITAPAQVMVGEELQLTVRAENTGTWVVEDVVPEISASGDGGVAPVADAAAAQDLLPGASHDFVLRATATRAGALSLSASIGGTDPRTGLPVSAEASTTVVVRPPPSVEVIAADPFGDGSAFAFVAAYGGRVILGPNRTGTGLVRMDPDGTALESLALSIARDVSGNVSSNGAYVSPYPGTYPSIGFTGCTTNSSFNRCGPDNENGRGFMTSVTFAGDEWLVLGGARSGGDLEYVYMSRSASSPLAFSYVDLSAALGGNTRGFSAAVAAGDRLYLGFPDNGGNRPYGLALLAAPAPSARGLDAVPGTHVVDLNLHEVYDERFGDGGDDFASVTMVDAIAELGGRVYFFNNLGCVASTSLAPMSKADFTACSPAETPLTSQYLPSQAVEPTRQHDLTPAERAWPAAVAWKGRLFAIRNTYTGPQLWRCDPAVGTNPNGCDRSDWTLVAADATTNYRTRFGKPSATAATLLLATSAHLWVGLDDPVSGIHLFRTAVEVPALASDFVGQGGCAAGSPGCEGFGGDGLGAGLTQILDAKVIEWSGGTDLVLTAGDGTIPVRAVRVAP